MKKYVQNIEKYGGIRGNIKEYGENMKKYVGNMKKYVGNTKRYAGNMKRYVGNTYVESLCE